MRILRTSSRRRIGSGGGFPLGTVVGKDAVFLKFLEGVDR
jgi:hypothetical protein